MDTTDITVEHTFLPHEDPDASLALDGTFERLRAGGAEVVQEPAEQPYGMRDCAFRDPAGTMVGVQERSRAVQRREAR